VKLGIPVYQGVDLLDVTGPLEMFNWAGHDGNPLAIA
jgi:cyclohexyl-isocyanide hydratase